MGTKFITIAVNGWLYLAFVSNGRTMLLHKSGRVGDCIRPGQKVTL